MKNQFKRANFWFTLIFATVILYSCTTDENDSLVDPDDQISNESIDKREVRLYEDFDYQIGNSKSPSKNVAEIKKMIQNAYHVIYDVDNNKAYILEKEQDEKAFFQANKHFDQPEVIMETKGPYANRIARSVVWLRHEDSFGHVGLVLMTRSSPNWFKLKTLRRGFPKREHWDTSNNWGAEVSNGNAGEFIAKHTAGGSIRTIFYENSDYKGKKRTFWLGKSNYRRVRFALGFTPSSHKTFN